MKRILLMLMNLILAISLLAGCMYDTSGSDINPNPDKPVDPIDPNLPVEGFKLYSGKFEAMNTVISFSMYAPNQAVANQVYNRIKAIYLEYDRVANDDFDSLTARRDPNTGHWIFVPNPQSELAILNHNRELKNPSKSLVELVEFADLMKEETNGYFNPYLGDLNHMWKLFIDGLGTEPSIGEKMLFTSISQTTNYTYQNNVLALTGEGNIDLGGVAKGYATQKAYDYLKAANVKYFILNAGNSNIIVGNSLGKDFYDVGVSYVFGYPNLKPKMEIKNGTLHIDDIDTKLKSKDNVTLRYGDEFNLKPKDGDIYFIPETCEYFVAENGAYRLKGTLTLTTIKAKNIGVCTSNPGQQHKKGDRNTHHLINAFTGEPSNIRDSVSITGPDSGRLDAYSTAIYSMTDEEAYRFLAEKKLSGLFIRDDKVYYRSEDL